MSSRTSPSCARPAMRVATPVLAKRRARSWWSAARDPGVAPWSIIVHTTSIEDGRYESDVDYTKMEL